MLSLVSYGFLAPPAVFITLCLLGALIALCWPRAGVALSLLSSLCLFAAATPALSTSLMHRLESALPRNPDFSKAQAIVVLGGDARYGNGGDIPDALGPLSLERVVLARAAAERLHLPLAVSGGEMIPGHASEAGLMKAALEGQFGMRVRWTDDRSRTTWENALFTARLLEPGKVTTIVLVSQAWHLPRAMWAFEQAGFKAVPWPAPRIALRLDGVDDYLPSVAALHDTFRALHELVGGAYYRWRYAARPQLAE
jgi:uncharacterized SAM-binding protein YcdF (DUF218 family)